ncbi:Aminopeptidase YpdF (MP-, MA-, MS-, AP-, NP-specific) [Olavius algarvensis associated proteobacterium Delta 3]|nr:Aminopeptidase YpdF (MP-, MA-, MS-, AP-, NP-specific) [Olavius algarvensis associated proteobacterium Delta 3]CAB5156502.1 Aminopeptidase YpdF (MP-, MA-, MS-, AP-, NP-specific) [Olavius algarvensis associated proteobacterium Delta 3]
MENTVKIRISQIRSAMEHQDIDTLLVMVGENRLYASGFTAEDTQFDESSGILLISQDRLLLATDARYDLQSKHEAPDFETVTCKKGLVEALPDLLEAMNVRRLGFESVRMSVHQFNELKQSLDRRDATVELVPVQNLVETFRLVKDQKEIDTLRKALRLAETGFGRVKQMLAPGTTESDVAWLLEKTLREDGAEGLSFPIIAAFGPNSALPHAVPGQRKLQPGEPLLFDWGVRLGGYCIDISRTLVVGPPEEPFQRVFQTVLDAQRKAIDAITPGVSGKQVDAVAREHIEAKGYQGKFGHGLGHGTGLAIHEAPRLSPIKDDVLEPGMVFTVEPGIYLPKWGGVRLENMVALMDDGPVVLNSTKPDDHYIL